MWWHSRKLAPFSLMWDFFRLPFGWGGSGIWFLCIWYFFDVQTSLLEMGFSMLYATCNLSLETEKLAWFCLSLLTCEAYFEMSNVFFASFCLETLKLKYIFVMELSSIECLLHLKALWEKTWTVGGWLGENGLNSYVSQISLVLCRVYL